jgi:hypothetical protein
MSPEAAEEIPPTTYTRICDQSGLDLLTMVGGFMPKLGYPEITVTWVEVVYDGTSSYETTVKNNQGGSLGFFWIAYNKAKKLLATGKPVEIPDLLTEKQLTIASRRNQPRRVPTPPKAAETSPKSAVAVSKGQANETPQLTTGQQKKLTEHEQMMAFS